MKNLFSLMTILFLFGCGNLDKKENTSSLKNIESIKGQIDSIICTESVIDFLKLKNKDLQAILFFKLDSVRKVQYPNNDQEKEIFIDLTPGHLDKFLEDIDLDSLKANNGFEKKYHFNISPEGYTDPKKCKDKIELSFDEEFCMFRLTIYNTFLVEPDWCTESNVVYGFQIQNDRVIRFGRNEAG